MAASWNIKKSKTQNLKITSPNSLFIYALKEAEVSTKCKLQILLCYKIVKHAI